MFNIRIRVPSTYDGSDGSPPNPKRRKVAPTEPEEQTNESSFPFSRLPGEIRNLIYKYALTATDGEIYIRRGPGEGTLDRTKPVRVSPGSRKKNFTDIALHLLQANKEIHGESTPLLYSRNTFHFDIVGDLSSFLGRHALHVRDLTRIVIDNSLNAHHGVTTRQHAEMAFSMLIFAENLEHLGITIDLHAKSHLQTVSAAANFHRMARNWLLAVGARKRDKLAALDILAFKSDTSWPRFHDQAAREAQLLVVFEDALNRLLRV
ncbi:hypothetical protein PMIN06_006029 [Paraphaeosphaeria minitans]|uniref:DUF7730 domain-containing protein n=1 Tax=Paraphaeosphaeria minitans TaxID=565426 RepID=A0A9P6GQU7_9PLEO|nr:hypothetical protein PMIN01_02498 [Paraphaeosphaeria minitans]